MKDSQNSAHITLLDGGMGRELMRIGAPFRQPEWSAISLMEAPSLVKAVHESFAMAGSDILTTNNYAVVPFHIGARRFFTEGAKLTELSGILAREVAATYDCRVAGSLPPLFGSYRPDLFVPEEAPALLAIIIEALDSHVDIWLAETISSIAEARAVTAALAGDDRPMWLSFTLLDCDEAKPELPRLRSGENVSSAVSAALDLGASALLFNCSQPEIMATAVHAAVLECKRLNVELPIGVYANALPSQTRDARANFNLHEIRRELDPDDYLAFAESWCALGARIIGGCCGIGPEHIAALRKRLK